MLANGFKIAKIHRALQFDQKPYMKTFIDIFVRQASEAKTKVEEEIFKLILNSICGRICENVCLRSRCDFLTDQTENSRIIANPNFTSFVIIHSNMFLLHREKRKMLLNKKIATGSAIYEISKNLMLEFYYNLYELQ